MRSGDDRVVEAVIENDLHADLDGLKGTGGLATVWAWQSRRRRGVRGDNARDSVPRTDAEAEREADEASAPSVRPNGRLASGRACSTAIWACRSTRACRGLRSTSGRSRSWRR